MALTLLRSLFIAPLLVAAQSTLDPTILCIPGQCLQGYSNVTLGAKLSSPSSPIPIHLLPGQYTSTTNPQFLHDGLTASSSTLTTSAGFTNGTLSLPLDLSLQPGLAIFSEHLYTGQTSFTTLPTSKANPNSSTPLDAKSIALSSNIVVIATSSSNRVILWDSVPDTQQLPSPLSSAQFSLVDIQSTSCTPACSSGGICLQSKCVCEDGFTGSACEDCAPGHFGPSCQKCEDGCEQCDEGISGTGRCLKQSGGGNTCNCLNGVCDSDGNCQCNDGFIKADNGTQCAKCADGFFQTSTGDCKVCQVGCNQCDSGTGVCLACKSGFTQDPNDRTKCIPPKQLTSSGSQCPELAFGNGASCTPCASPCQSCSGGTSNDCTACAQGLYMLNGVCVRANGDGICEGTNLFADNNKQACDSCGAKCTSCKIPNFTPASVANDLQCTGCIPGSFLLNGKCIDSCPSGTFASQDNACLPCDSSCSTCSGSATFCLTCSSQNQLSFNGQCLSAGSCPKSTFASPSTSSCLSCHADCAACSGSSFNQCTSCPPDRPVLNTGRCMPTCAKNEYWDPTANACKTCDSSCGSCSGPGSSSCLSCSNTNDRVLRSGSCAPSSDICTSSNVTTVISTLGVCLSELVVIPKPSETSTLAPLPTVTGINQPTSVAKGGRRLEWWQILLMALGCAFIFLAVIWCCRRRLRKRKEAEKKRIQAYAFAHATTKNSSSWWKCTGKRDKKSQAYHPDLDDHEIPIHTGSPHHQKGKNNWKWRLVRLGEKFFGHPKSTRLYHDSSMEIGPMVRGKTITVLSETKHHPTNSHSSERSFQSADHDRDLGHGRPPRPSRSSDEHSLLDVPIDVGSSDGEFDHRYRDDRRGQGRAHNSLSEQGRNEQEREEEMEDMLQLISSYRYTINPPPATKPNSLYRGGSRPRSNRANASHHSSNSKTHLLAPSPPRSHRDRSHSLGRSGSGEYEYDEEYRISRSSISTDSIYSQVTGHMHRMPNVRQPVRDDVPPVPVLTSKFSMSTIGVGDEENGRLIGRSKLKKKLGSGSFWK